MGERYKTYFTVNGRTVKGILVERKNGRETT
jgi:hypothetical protein